MKDKKVKVADPNYRVKGWISFLIAVVVLGSSAFFGIKYYNGDFEEPEDGSYNAIVDITSPVVAAEFVEGEEEDSQTVRVTVTDEVGGSALYGLCVTEEENLDEVKKSNSECWDTFSLMSQIEYTVDIDFPISDDSAIYYLSAKDNFGNYSKPYQIIIKK